MNPPMNQTGEPKKRGKPCVVPGCMDKFSSGHRFPTKTDTFNAWFQRVNNPKLFSIPKLKICGNCVVCDRHFEDSCRLPGHKKLRNGSVPTLFLPNKEDCTEAADILLKAPIDLPTIPEDALDHQLVDADRLLDSDSLDPGDDQEAFLSKLFHSAKPAEPPCPNRLPENKSSINDTDNTVLVERIDDDWVEVFYIDGEIDFNRSDVIKIEVEGVEEVEEVEQVGEVEYVGEVVQGGEVEEVEQVEEVDQVGEVEEVEQVVEVDEVEQVNDVEEVEQVVPSALEKPYFKSVKSYLVDSRSMTEVCRICFRSILDEEMTKLYEEDNIEEANNIRNMLKLVLPDLDLEIYPNSVVCTMCQELLFCSYKLKERWLTTEEKLQKIISKKKGVTNRDADLVLVAKAVTVNNSNKDKIDKKENSVKINGVKRRNRAKKQMLSHKESATGREVSDCNGRLDNKQENGTGLKLAILRDKLLQVLQDRKDSKIDPEVSDYHTDLNIENSSKEPNTNFNKNQETFNTKTCSLRHENDVEIKPAKVTNKVVRDILSHNDSSAINLEVTIYHGDLDNLNNASTEYQNEDIFSSENDIERPAEATDSVMQDISNQNNSVTIPSANPGDLETEKQVENRKPSNVKERSRQGQAIWGLGPYICEVCGRIFRWLRSLKYHLKRHAEQPKLKLKRKKETMCELCGQLFTSKRFLGMHLEKHSRRHDCSICQKVFKDSSSLKLHVLRTHMGEYEYSQCHLCGKQLNRKSLRIHLLSHAAQKPHPCPICNKRFIFPSNLKKHLRKHSDEKLSCEYCGKGIKYRHTLQKHIRIYHKNQADFRCEFCLRPYWKKVDLIKHKIRIHGWSSETEANLIYN